MTLVMVEKKDNHILLSADRNWIWGMTRFLKVSKIYSDKTKKLYLAWSWIHLDPEYIKSVIDKNFHPSKLLDSILKIWNILDDNYKKWHESDKWSQPFIMIYNWLIYSYSYWQCMKVDIDFLSCWSAKDDAYAIYHYCKRTSSEFIHELVYHTIHTDCDPEISKEFDFITISYAS